MDKKALLYNVLLAELLKKYPLILTLQQAADLLLFSSVNALRLAEHHNRLPIPFRCVGGHQCMYITDIIDIVLADDDMVAVSPPPARCQARDY